MAPVTIMSEAPDLSTFAGRLQDARGEMTQDELARRIGVTRVTVSRWENQERQPRRGHIELIAEACRVNPGWLLSGVGPRTATGAEVEPDTEGMEDIAAVNLPLLEVRPPTRDHVGATPKWGGRMYPVPRAWIGQHGLDAGQVVTVRVVGSSMSPTLNENDIVLVDTRPTEVTHAGIYALVLGGALVFRFAERLTNGKISIRADDPRWKSYEDDTVEVFGRAVKLAGRDL